MLAIPGILVKLKWFAVGLSSDVSAEGRLRTTNLLSAILLPVESRFKPISSTALGKAYIVPEPFLRGLSKGVICLAIVNLS